MGIDAKDVGIIVWKILRVSTSTTCRYVRKYPVGFGVSAFIILLYTFLPWLFFFMLWSSPLVASLAFYLRNHLSSKIVNNSTEESKSDGGLSGNGNGSVSRESKAQKAELRHQRSVRRNARRKVEEVGKDWESSQASEHERGKVILTTLYGEFADTSTRDLNFKRDRTLLVGEESSFESNLDKKENVVLDPLERLTSGGETEIECSSSSEEEEEKEIGEDRDKVVAWTEDDQKNLINLGTSEIERNKRLENLVSRRRARRLFLLAAERSLMDMAVPRICVGRNYYGLDDQENYEIDGLLMPASAPSVLLPTRNPFDLPYDPQEEKPNLTWDNFQQEFAETNPKDIFFSRHESFRHGVFPSEAQQDSWRKSVDGRHRLQQADVGSSDHMVAEQQPIMKEKDVKKAEGDEVEAGEVRIETDSIRNDDSDSTLSPREREKDYNVSDQAHVSRTSWKRNGDHVGNSLVGLVPKSSGSSSLAAERQRYMEHFGYSTRKCHTVSHSVDSDLQVEVSELGSPPTTVDGNDSSDEEKSRIINELDMAKEMAFDSDESEMKLNGVVDRIAESEMLDVEKIDQDHDETGSLISPENDAVSAETSEHERSKSREFLQPKPNREQEPMVPHSDEVSSESVEESTTTPQNSAEEIKISYESDEPEPSERTDQESEEQCERNDGGQEMPELAEEAEASVINPGTSEESGTSPRSVLPDMLPLDQTHSEDLEHTSDSQPQNVRQLLNSPQNQLDGGLNTGQSEEESRLTVEATGEASTSDSTETIQEKQEESEVTINDETKTEDHRLPLDPTDEELNNNQKDG